MLATVYLYRVSGAERRAVVSLEPSSTPGAWMMRLAKGKSGTVYGPFPAAIVRARYDELLAQLESEGFVRAGREDTFTALTSSAPGVRARAALRIGWRKDRNGVAPLLSILAAAKRDTPAIIDALGMIGDASAIEAIRPHAEKQLLSRRRSAVEALRNLGDIDGLALARQRGIARLPPPVADALAKLDEHDVRSANLTPLIDSLRDLETKDRAMIADALYEADTPATIAVAMRLLRSIPIEKPHAWRYAKSIYKRAMLRQDARMFGWLSHAIEQRARVSKGVKETLKSGLDGEKRPTYVFGKKTQAYVRRLGFRYLRRIARWRPDQYAEIAAEVLLQHGPEDLRPPKGRVGRFGECYLLSKILWGGGDRFVFDTRAMRVRFRNAKAVNAPPNVREEVYPELWDARPRAFLRVASTSKLPEVLDFAARGIARHAYIVEDAGPKTLLGLLGSGHDGLVAIAIREIERRFDPKRPDASLLARLVGDESGRELGRRLAEASASVWAIDANAVIEILGAARGAIGAALAHAAASVLGDRTGARASVAKALLAALREPEAEEGAHGALAELARALLVEIDALLSTDDLLAILDAGSNAARAIAGGVLGRRPAAFEALGNERVRALAESEIASVRRAAHALLSAATPRDPSLLFALAESVWADTRTVALAILRDVIGVERLGLDGWIGLCDSRFPDVRALGRDVLARSFDAIDPQEALFKLVEHPSRDMRRFALSLVEDHLKPGYVPLSRIEAFTKAVLLDLSPDRGVKRRLIAFLEKRGASDERQAELVLAILSNVVRTKTVHDFERVLSAIAATRIAFPALSCEAVEVRAS